MKNIIQQQDPEQALKLAIKDLRGQFEQLKQTQPPTVNLTTIGSVVSTIQALTPTVVTHRHSVIATLTPPSNNPVLMAFPEWSFFNVNGANDADGHWPDGPFWKQAANRPYENILDMNWWFSWGLTNNTNIVALLDQVRNDYGSHPPTGTDNNPDGTTFNNMGFYLYLRWRYLVPGSA